MKKTTSVISIFLVLVVVFSLLVLMLNLKNGGTKVDDNDKPPGTSTLPSTDNSDPSFDLDEINIAGTWVGKEETVYWTMENGWNDFGWQEENISGSIFNTVDGLDGASFDQICLEADVPYMHFYFEGSELVQLVPTGPNDLNSVVLNIYDESNETASDGFKEWLITNFERQVDN